MSKKVIIILIIITIIVVSIIGIVVKNNIKSENKTSNLIATEKEGDIIVLTMDEYNLEERESIYDIDPNYNPRFP